MIFVVGAGVGAFYSLALVKIFISWKAEEGSLMVCLKLTFQFHSLSSSSVSVDDIDVYSKNND